MPNGVLFSGMPVDFADVILIINGFAIAMLIGLLYIEKILAGWNFAMGKFHALNLRARFRIWRTAHR
jgi:hypothetical protein